MSNDTSRRDFLKTSAATGGVLAAGVLTNAHAQENNDIVRVGLVGCGGRGSGAVEQCLRADPNCRLVAVSDTFMDRAKSCLLNLKANAALAAKVDVPTERIFIGLQGYRQVIANCDLVLLATPPGFRPVHIRDVIAARKHLFTEKPVAVDSPGIRMVLAAHAEADRQNLTVVAGTQRRYQTGYLETMQRIHDGVIGTITSGRCYWNQADLWHRARTLGMTDVEWMIRNWLYFTWLSGDHIVEQHVHNLDVINWAIQAHPLRCVGMGGRQVRTAKNFGHIFDHFAVDYEYPNNVHVMSMCRQIRGCAGNISESVTGTRGVCDTAAGPRLYRITGERPWSMPRNRDNEPYQAEHVALFDSIRGRRRRLNDLRAVAESTLTAIMGRMSAYTGQEVTWDQALQSQQVLVPDNLTWDTRIAMPAVAVPGTTELT
ncbi:MAG: twin-arginine translocation signal domain-containing protein [Planctomycetes bacterium]|nr:twin-arginine translocation signal domain-containing protein [Planctomycetota bacterium]